MRAPVHADRTSRVVRWVLVGAGLVVLAVVAVLVARWLRGLEPVADFLVRFPGGYHLPEGAPVGLPAWLGWQHFLNMFFLVLIVRTGWQIRTEKRPSAFFTTRSKRRMSLTMWLHQAVDVLWIANGVVFVVLLFVTGQWMRIVPTSWEVFPNALSAGLQFVSLDWPTENGWVNYNSLQQLAYFSVVFIAAPLAIATGVRMSAVLPRGNARLDRLYPLEWARKVHFPVMLFFVLFVIAHVTLVLTTGALRNLNHIYTASDEVNWVGFAIFIGSLLVTAAAVALARPLVVASVARRFGEVTSR